MGTSLYEHCLYHGSKSFSITVWKVNKGLLPAGGQASVCDNLRDATFALRDVCCVVLQSGFYHLCYLHFLFLCQWRHPWKKETFDFFFLIFFFYKSFRIKGVTSVTHELFNDQCAHYSPKRIDTFDRQGCLSSAVQMGWTESCSQGKNKQKERPDRKKNWLRMPKNYWTVDLGCFTLDSLLSFCSLILTFIYLDSNYT